MNKTSKYTGTQSQPASATASPKFHRNLGVQAKNCIKQVSEKYCLSLVISHNNWVNVFFLLQEL